MRIIAILGLLVTMGCGGDKGTADSGGGGDAGADGRAVYDDNCASCHGADGGGGIGTALNGGVIDGLSDDDLAAIIENGIAPTMPAFTMSEDDQAALIAFLRSEFGT